MKQRLTRAEVSAEMTWKLEDLFAREEDWEQEFKAVGVALSKLDKYQGQLKEGPAIVLDCLKDVETLIKRFSQVMSYASLKLAGDGTDPANQTAMGRAGGLGAQFQAAIASLRSELIALPDGQLEQYLHEDGRFKDFARLLEKIIADKPHVLHPEAEKALASLSEVLDSPYMVYERSKSSDMSFAPIEDSQGKSYPMSFALYEEDYEISPDTVLRRNAFASFTKGLKAYENTYGAIWGTEVKKNVVLARLRKFASATHMLLHEQEVSIEAYHTLHDVILKELAPHMRRYAQLRKRVLGLDKLLYCDIEAPLDPEFAPATSLKQAGEIILKSLAVLGQEYTDIIGQGLNNRWLDLADNIGKSTGAFCATVPGVHPYILATWTDSLRTTLTLAHELGHAGHGVLTERYQCFANSGYSKFFVEAPSTINELLVAEQIKSESSDPRMLCWLDMQMLQTYHHNFVRHLIEGELQRRTYVLAEQGQPITASVLSNTQGEILEEFWGGEVEIDEGARLTWMRQPHYYMGLYPYSYSAGLTVATAVARAIREEGRHAVDRWLTVLKAGGSKPPVELAKMAGVDMTRPEAIRKAVDYVGELVEGVERYF
ncbi:MAG: oligoendopeptidase F [Eubacteriales bacterium]|nr:oligoendopeptidase F [Eubacteriales bacterium]